MLGFHMFSNVMRPNQGHSRARLTRRNAQTQSAPATKIAIHDIQIGTTQPATCAGQSNISLTTWPSATTPKITPVIWMYVRIVLAPLDESTCAVKKLFLMRPNVQSPEAARWRDRSQQ